MVRMMLRTFFRGFICVKTVFLTPQGETFTQKKARELASEDALIFLCGHYEGIDERVLEETVNGLGETVDGLEETLNNLDETIDGLQETVTELEEQISGLADGNEEEF